MSQAPAEMPTVAPAPPSGQGSFAWDEPPRVWARATSPVLAVDGFEGPLDWLLEMVRARKIDLARLSIVALVEAFASAMDVALNRAPDAPAPDLARWGDWTVMAADLTQLRSRLLLPVDAPEARTAQAEAEALSQRWLRHTETAEAADWLERRPQLGFEVFARGRSGRVRAQRAAGLEEDGGDLGAGTVEAYFSEEDLPVVGGDLTDLLRACLVALRLPADITTYQPRLPPFWSISAAAARITRLIDEWPEGTALAA